MPVILENGSDELRTWLNPTQSTWSKELQNLLKPFQGELEVYPVSKDVGKVGNNSPNFIIPVASSENKSNIANFFAKGATKGASKENRPKKSQSPEYSDDETKKKLSTQIKHEPDEDRKTLDHDGTENNAPLPVPTEENKQGVKRELEDVPENEPPSKLLRASASPSKASSPAKPASKTRSATSNKKTSPQKSVSNEKGSQKITNFFGK